MRHSKSGLLLMEIIICIFFFALSATICVRLFAYSHSVSKDNVIKNHAVIALENLSEAFYASYGDTEEIASEYYSDTAVCAGDAGGTGTALTIYYNDDFNEIPQKEISSDFTDYAYTAILQVNQDSDDDLTNGSVSYYSHYVTEKGAEITEQVCSMNLTVHKPNTLTK